MQGVLLVPSRTNYLRFVLRYHSAIIQYTDPWRPFSRATSHVAQTAAMARPCFSSLHYRIRKEITQHCRVGVFMAAKFISHAWVLSCQNHIYTSCAIQTLRF
jgi:hypothetical protein